MMFRVTLCVILLCIFPLHVRCAPGVDSVVSSALYDPTSSTSLSRSFLFVNAPGFPTTNPGTPSDGVTLLSYSWATITTNSGPSSACTTYLEDSSNAPDCCIGTDKDSNGNYIPQPPGTGHNYGYGACKSSSNHDCPGSADATCTAGSNWDGNSNNPASCPAFIDSSVSGAGKDLYPRCRPATLECYTSEKHCWGTIACFDTPTPDQNTLPVGCPPGGFVDVNSQGKTVVYHDGDFCFEAGGSQNSKWCASLTCTDPFVLSTNGLQCVCPSPTVLVGEICCIPVPDSNPPICRGNAGPSGDPQIGGFQGQSFQFHGLPDEVFNLISTPSLQVNGHFVYLSSGKCDYNDTTCWTHPGTYIDQLGFSFGTHRVKIVASTHHVGLRLEIDGEQIFYGNYKLHANGTDVHIKYQQHGQVHIRTHEFAFTIENSDMFFNMEASLLNHHLLRIGASQHTITDSYLCKKEESIDETTFQQTHPKHQHNHGAVESSIQSKYGGIQVPLHGLVGQTWRNVIVCGKHWVGTVTDYLASDLFASDYFFNFYHRD